VIYRSNGYLGSKLSLAGFVVNLSPVARYRVAESVTCSHAADGGHLHVLQYARGHAFPWDSWTSANAAAGGYLEVLKWLREHHCPWDEATCTHAPGCAQMGAGARVPRPQPWDILTTFLSPSEADSRS